MWDYLTSFNSRLRIKTHAVLMDNVFLVYLGVTIVAGKNVSILKMTFLCYPKMFV
jgi:hypothetical protein